MMRELKRDRRLQRSFGGALDAERELEVVEADQIRGHVDLADNLEGECIYLNLTGSRRALSRPSLQQA